MSANIQLGVSTVMAGELLTTTTGEETVAMQDVVVLVAYSDGVPHGCYQLTVEQAMTFAGAVSSAAGSILNRQVGDDGKPLPLLTRLARLKGN